MSPAVTFFSLLRSTRPDFLATMTPGEREVMREHMEYVKSLFDRGKILFGGAATDGTMGILVYQVRTAAEAQELFDNDPAVKAGFGIPELHPFHVGYIGTMEL